ncbi:hypothetical protein MNEG_2206 [Monoraphidium neglectum]|uniref:BTB domain-containing protein n=1 Tax=Monoraphidium neglectum TaxID=145388 RepID=A0A0D2K5X9_9CHLO|nr:hypothetical protein MNEG_2206 [Monoraphidium neglectum]KIZ05753.1 hypothetical protein MNEG_2206 [Monoraphidium neglectum]|eukprot:XP_013904772.1 hypothetical protein MNEG_2206 [Monoraphidium neglectum]
MMSSSAPGLVDPALSKMLELCPSALLSCDDGTSLPVSRELLMIASPMLRDMLASAHLDAAPGGASIIPLPGDKRKDWLLSLPFLYHHAPDVTWDSVEALTELCIKYDLQGLRPFLDRFLWASAATLSGQVPPGSPTTRKLSVAAVGEASAVGQWSVWRWLVLAARCKLSASVEAFCHLIVRCGLAVPKDFDLGLAGQPLAVKLAHKLSTSY